MKWRSIGQKKTIKSNFYHYYPIHLETTEFKLSFQEKFCRAFTYFFTYPDGTYSSDIKIILESREWLASNGLPLEREGRGVPAFLPYYSSIERTVITGARLCIVLRGKIFVNKCRGCAPCWERKNRRVG